MPVDPNDLEPVKPSGQVDASDLEPVNPADLEPAGPKMPYPDPGTGTAVKSGVRSETLPALQEYGRGLWDLANPAAALQGINAAFYHPIETAKALGNQQDITLNKAVDSYKKGDYANAARHFVGYLLPVVGPQIDMMGDLAASGHLARALGQATTLGVTSALGARSSLLPKVAEAPAIATTAEDFMPTPAETAATVAERSSPETALQNFMKARDIASAKAAYQAASPSMRQTMQQQQLFQVMKQSEGDPAAFGKMMDEWKDAIPLEDHQTWEGAKRAGLFEENAQRVGKVAAPWQSVVDIAGMLHVPGAESASRVLAGAKTLSWLISRPGGRNILAKLGSLEPTSPKFAVLWNTAKTAATAIPPAQALDQRQAPTYAGGGPVIERLKQGMLRQLRGD